MKKGIMKDFRIDLQLFAEGEGESAAQEPAAKEAETSKDQPPAKTYTEEELAKEREKIEKQREGDIKKAVEEALKEQKRLSKLSEEERRKEEQSAKEQELLKREQAILFKERLSEVRDELHNRKLPSVFAEYFIAEDSKESLEKIKAFEAAFQKAVQEAVDSKIQGVQMRTGGSLEATQSSEAAEIAKNKNEQGKGIEDPWKM